MKAEAMIIEMKEQAMMMIAAVFFERIAEPLFEKDSRRILWNESLFLLVFN